MDVSAVEDPVQRRALETMIKTYGQTPRQLFNGSHVSRAASRVLMEGELPAAMGLLVQLAFREAREATKEVACPVTPHPPPSGPPRFFSRQLSDRRRRPSSSVRAHCRGSEA